jgi:general secretion pathway protein N
MSLKTFTAATGLSKSSKSFALGALGALERPSKRRTLTPQAAAPWRWALLGALLGGMMTLLLYAPAQWLAQAVALASHGQVQLQEARGTVWQGSAQVVLTGGAGSRDAQALPGHISWTLQPLSANPQLALRSDCCMPTPLLLRISPAWDGAQLQLSDTPSTWPAALLTGLGAPWNTLQPEGDLSLVPQQLRLQWQSGRFSVQGSLKLTAHHMASRLTPLKPIGTYQVDITTSATASGTLDVKLSTVSGSLLLSGQGQWQGQRLHFQGEASAAPDHEAALDNLLSIIGRRQGARSLLSWG